MVGPCDPLQGKEGLLSTKSYLVDARRMLLFRANLMGEVWLRHNADTQCTVEGRENVSYINFSYLAMKYEFYFTVTSRLNIWM